MRVLAGEVKEIHFPGISLMPELAAVWLTHNDKKNWLKGTSAINSGKETILEFSNYFNKESFRRFCICEGDHVVLDQQAIFDDWSKARCGGAIRKIH